VIEHGLQFFRYPIPVRRDALSLAPVVFRLTGFEFGKGVTLAVQVIAVCIGYALVNESKIANRLSERSGCPAHCTLDKSHPTYDDDTGACRHAHCIEHLDLADRYASGLSR